MALVAGVLAIVLIVVLVGARVMLRPQGHNQPAPAASPVASPPAADSFPCKLAVTTAVELGDQVIAGRGFINVPDGDYHLDPTATVSDLPHAAGAAPAYYSATLSRWLPAIPPAISPDGTQYAYVTQSGSTSQLHVVDVPTRADRVIWTYGASIGVEAWDDSGILVATVPFAGGQAQIWRIDPATGSASRRPAGEQVPTLPPLWALPPGGWSFSPMGNDGRGSIVVRFDRGTTLKVVLVNVPAHTETTLYSGARNANGFDPETALFDAHGIWMSNLDARKLWLWTASSGLTGFPVTGLPTVPAGDRHANVSFYTAGPCVPGTFTV
ncbi:MAG TPA: hypothetical protein VFL29_05765 [Candidatus Dormibacteraeota bacterium]|nr:hypothetical protein [Candidatus Dormibacteraeota bacterium]